jgi:hypothetical protein
MAGIRNVRRQGGEREERTGGGGEENVRALTVIKLNQLLESCLYDATSPSGL